MAIRDSIMDFLKARGQCKFYTLNEFNKGLSNRYSSDQIAMALRAMHRDKTLCRKIIRRAGYAYGFPLRTDDGASMFQRRVIKFLTDTGENCSTKEKAYCNYAIKCVEASVKL